MEAAIKIANKLPPMKDLSAENITENVHIVNSNCPDPRFKFLMSRLVDHLHAFASEVRLSSEEWMAALQFLTRTGQTCTDLRQEFILLSDVLGLSLLVDSMDHQKPAGSTEGTLLGPFHTHDAHDLSHGDGLSGDPNGQPLLVVCSVKDAITKEPLSGVRVDIWETDSNGKYDTQYASRNGPDGRGILTSDVNGIFWFKAIVPVPYPIPHDGPVGDLLGKLHRHPYRPSHMHYKFEKPGHDSLITALYLRHDPFESCDAVFGVKDSLLVDLVTVDEATATKYDTVKGTKMLRHEFFLAPETEIVKLKEQTGNGTWSNRS